MNIYKFKYQDDCIALNDNGIFAQHFHLIYPPEMILKCLCTDISKAVCTFLDLRISVFVENSDTRPLTSVMISVFE